MNLSHIGLPAHVNIHTGLYQRLNSYHMVTLIAFTQIQKKETEFISVS